ncbi:MAG: sigma-70 family RNA polymerase sigma factor [Planctomycetes bacterium]|nr:sigma-70 family RNA polymerase sigma factor [Planctomycetota bacterium]
MNAVSTKSSSAGTNRLHFLFHPSFEAGDGESLYGAPVIDECDPRGFMPDDVTRDFSKRMHYAAWRASEATTGREATCWRRAYIEVRNGIVLGNRKLIFKAVQKWASCGLLADDLVSECQLVLIKAVAAYNPWLGVRFSTYAFTCLMRALSRLAQRHAADRLSRSRSLESLPYDTPASHDCAGAIDPRLDSLGQFLQDDAPFLTAREKLVISRRYLLTKQNQETETLEQVGRDLGVSKERVRQVQKSALLKLREALTDGVSA